MSGPKPTVDVSLTSAQRAVLERWVRQRKGPQDRGQRARTLVSAAGARNAAEALADATPEDLEERMDRVLADAPRPGAPATFTSEQIAQTIVVACEKPSECDVP